MAKRENLTEELNRMLKLAGVLNEAINQDQINIGNHLFEYIAGTLPEILAEINVKVGGPSYVGDYKPNESNTVVIRLPIKTGSGPIPNNIKDHVISSIEDMDLEYPINFRFVDCKITTGRPLQGGTHIQFVFSYEI